MGVPSFEASSDFKFSQNQGKRPQFTNPEAMGHSFNISDRKVGKGKPKTVLEKYHLQCQAMIKKNFNDIMRTNCKREKQRIKNLNNSLLQRLKRRREQENDARLFKLRQ